MMYKKCNSETKSRRDQSDSQGYFTLNDVRMAANVDGGPGMSETKEKQKENSEGARQRLKRFFNKKEKLPLKTMPMPDVTPLVSRKWLETMLSRLLGKTGKKKQGEPEGNSEPSTEFSPEEESRAFEDIDDLSSFSPSPPSDANGSASSSWLCCLLLILLVLLLITMLCWRMEIDDDEVNGSDLDLPFFSDGTDYLSFDLELILILKLKLIKMLDLSTLVALIAFIVIITVACLPIRPFLKMIVLSLMLFFIITTMIFILLDDEELNTAVREHGTESLQTQNIQETSHAMYKYRVVYKTDS